MCTVGMNVWKRSFLWTVVVSTCVAEPLFYPHPRYEPNIDIYQAKLAQLHTELGIQTIQTTLTLSPDAEASLHPAVHPAVQYTS